MRGVMRYILCTFVVKLSYAHRLNEEAVSEIRDMMDDTLLPVYGGMMDHDSVFFIIIKDRIFVSFECNFFLGNFLT